MQAMPGDKLLVKERRAGEGDRQAVIIEVWSEVGRPPYVVRWQDGSQNILFPASVDVLLPAAVRRGSQAQAGGVTRRTA